MPSDIRIKTDYGHYSSSFLREGDRLFVEERLTLLANQIPVTKYSLFYDFIKSIIDYKKKTAIVIK